MGTLRPTKYTRIRTESGLLLYYNNCSVCDKLILRPSTRCLECSHKQWLADSPYHHNAFATWSHEMAYMLGLIATDGCVYPPNRGVIYVTTDVELATSFQLFAGIPKLPTPRHDPRGKDCYYVRVTSEQMVNDLIALNITPAKSKTLQMPPVPDEYFPDFARGCWDGDGTITLRLGRLVALFSSSSPNFIHAMNERLTRMIGRPSPLPQSSRPDHPAIIINTLDAIRLCQCMYEHVPYLHRKYQVYADYIARHPNWCTRANVGQLLLPQ